MKIFSSIFIIILLASSITSFAQSTDKQYKQVLKDYSAHNYSTMLRHLDKLDEKYKSEASYLQYKAIANDSLGEYDAAVKDYDAYLQLNATDSLSASRALTLKQILVVRSRCLKCKGSGTISKEAICGNCQGRSVYRAPCKSCNGEKKAECSSCSGAGRIQGPNGQVTCGKCGGSGKNACTRCNQTGYLEEGCRNCSGGFIIDKTKCNEHP